MPGRRGRVHREDDGRHVHRPVQVGDLLKRRRAVVVGPEVLGGRLEQLVVQGEVAMAVDLDVHVDIDGGQRFSPHSQSYPSNTASNMSRATASAGGAREFPRSKNIRKPDCRIPGSRPPRRGVRDCRAHRGVLVPVRKAGPPLVAAAMRDSGAGGHMSVAEEFTERPARRRSRRRSRSRITSMHPAAARSRRSPTTGSSPTARCPRWSRRAANVEWMCLPRMDGPSVFAAILDRDAGSFRLGPADVMVPAGRRYLPGTMILETTWGTPTGWAVVRDVLLDRAVAAPADPVRHASAGAGRSRCRTACCCAPSAA